MRIGITGHMNLTDRTKGLVREAIDAELSQYDPARLIGFSCLAEGADSIFAAAANRVMYACETRSSNVSACSGLTRVSR